jgi:hypothetical protein
MARLKLVKPLAQFLQPVRVWSRHDHPPMAKNLLKNRPSRHSEGARTIGAAFFGVKNDRFNASS